MAITTYRTLGYAGFVKQSAQGSGGAPTKFLKNVKSTFAPMERISDWSNGNVLDVSFSLKELFHYAGDMQFFSFADELAMMLAFVMGTDTKTGSGDPWTHTLALANSLPWVSVEVSEYENQILDRVIDSKVGKLLIEGDAGKAVLATASLLGCSVAVQNSAATVTFSDGATEGPLMFYNGAITLTGPSDYATLAGQVQKFSFEIDRNLSIEPGPGQITPIYLLEQRRTIKCKMQALFSGPAVYNLMHYGTSAGTAVANALGTGTAEWKLTSAASPEHSIDMTLANATWQLAKPAYDPMGKTGLIDLELIGYRSGATLPFSAVCKNGYNTAYV